MAGIAVLLLAGAAYLMSKRQYEAYHSEDDPLADAPKEYGQLTMWAQDDLQEKTFAAQPQTTVRVPYGPNPDTHYINSPEQFFNYGYSVDYVQNLWDLRVEPENFDWRFDPTENSELVNASQPISPCGLQMTLNYMNKKLGMGY